MTRAQWSNPRFRAKWYAKRREERRETAKLRYHSAKGEQCAGLGVFAISRATYRHNGRTCFV